MNEIWDKTNKLDLVKFVYFAKKSEAVQNFITQGREASLLPASAYDYHLDEPRELIKKIYNALYQQNIEYEINENVHFLNHNQQQIRTAEVIQKEKKGNCLDLAILFCAICYYFDLLPILILLNGHILAAVSLTHRYSNWDNEERLGKKLFWDGGGILEDKDKLIDMLDRNKYLAVECTGFARSETLSEEGFKRENGFLSFEQALKCGKQIVKKIETKEFFGALDIPIGYKFWLSRIFKERLDQDVPKSFNNNKSLDEIYVPLGLIQRKKNVIRRPSPDKFNPENSEFNQPDEIDIDKNSNVKSQGKRDKELNKQDEKDEDETYEIVKKYENDEFLEEVLKTNFSNMSERKRLLITGDPGGGKSTFLQKIAYWVLDHEQGLPIWISLAQFNENLVADKHVGDSGWLFRYLLEKWLKNLSQEGKETPKKWQDKFEELLKTRQLWLILDGADEMAVSYALKKIQEQLAKGWAKSVNVVLSCRLNLWEQQQKNALSEKFKIYRTLDFNYPEQVHQFIDNWFGKGDVKAIGLKEQLDKDNRIRQQSLVKNPLQGKRI